MFFFLPFCIVLDMTCACFLITSLDHVSNSKASFSNHICKHLISCAVLQQVYLQDLTFNSIGYRTLLHFSFIYYSYFKVFMT